MAANRTYTKTQDKIAYVVCIGGVKSRAFWTEREAQLNIDQSMEARATSGPGITLVKEIVETNKVKAGVIGKLSAIERLVMGL